jgi:acyl carrier protein
LTRKSWIKKNIEESTNIQLKKEVSVKSGYRYTFVTEDDLTDINSFKKCLDLDSTTNLDIGVSLK